MCGLSHCSLSSFFPFSMVTCMWSFFLSFPHNGLLTFSFFGISLSLSPLPFHQIFFTISSSLYVCLFFGHRLLLNHSASGLPSAMSRKAVRNRTWGEKGEGQLLRCASSNAWFCVLPEAFCSSLICLSPVFRLLSSPTRLNQGSWNRASEYSLFFFRFCFLFVFLVH